jgi:hypothetical protein
LEKLKANNSVQGATKIVLHKTTVSEKATSNSTRLISFLLFLVTEVFFQKLNQSSQCTMHA